MDENRPRSQALLGNEKKDRIMNRVRSMVRLFARMLIGAVIGITVVIIYFVIDYVGSSEKQLYFIDKRDTFIAVLTLGIMIGVSTGIAWAIGRYFNRQTPLSR
jgi:hypothetical protein